MTSDASMRTDTSVEERAALHAALGDPVRLAVVDELAVSDRSPLELGRRLGVGSNLLAHHLDVLEGVGVVERSRSSGDGRRRYVHLVRERLGETAPRRGVPRAPALFVCTANSARSQLAASLWRHLTGAPADSAGTRPADRVHPSAVAAARRAGLDLSGAAPRRLGDREQYPPVLVTVCDRAHEEVAGDASWLHWSVTDPVAVGTDAAFDAAVAELRDRIRAVVATPGAAA